MFLHLLCCTIYVRGPVCHVHLFIRDQITFAYNKGTTKRSLITQYMFYSSTRLWVLVKLGFKRYFFFLPKNTLMRKFRLKLNKVKQFLERFLVSVSLIVFSEKSKFDDLSFTFENIVNTGVWLTKLAWSVTKGSRDSFIQVRVFREQWKTTILFGLIKTIKKILECD